MVHIMAQLRQLKIGVSQQCVLLTLLLNCVLDIVMQKSTSHRGGFTLSLQDRFEDMDYTDATCFLSHSFSDM